LKHSLNHLNPVYLKHVKGWAETQATYRFYSNESVTWEKLLTAHKGQVEQRIIKSEEPVILCLQDTTELDFNGQETEGLGRLSYYVLLEK